MLSSSQGYKEEFLMRLSLPSISHSRAISLGQGSSLLCHSFIPGSEVVTEAEPALSTDVQVLRLPPGERFCGLCPSSSHCLCICVPNLCFSLIRTLVIEFGACIGNSVFFTEPHILRPFQMLRLHIWTPRILVCIYLWNHHSASCTWKMNPEVEGKKYPEIHTTLGGTGAQ
jgi:hypothetical protein